MKKILIISTSSDLGGGPMHILSLLRNLQSSYAFYLAIPKDGVLSEDLHENCISSVHIPADRFSIVAAVRLLIFIYTFNIKIVHSHGKGGGVYARFVKLFFWFINVIHTCHGVHYEKYGNYKKLIYKAYENFTINLNKKMIFVSNSEKVKLETFIGKQVFRSCVISNGTSVQYQACEVISNLSRSLARIRITFIGRLDPIKNVMAVLKLARALEEKGGSFVIKVIGDGSQRELFVSQMQILNLKFPNEIFYLGARKDVFKILKETDVLFNSSLSEGHPLTLLEAMSVGAICLASNVAGNKDIIEHNINGLLYPLNDIDQAADLLLDVQNGEGKIDELMLNGWLKHCQNFSDEKCFGALKAHYAIL
jgi:glycosyltransferase involved in cell wall biosynthesis